MLAVMPQPYRYPVTPRYVEIDQQGIVFNAWYLVWFDEAMAGYLAACGVPIPALIDGGHDVRLVRSEMDWKAPVVSGQDVFVEVTTAAIGKTSLTLGFDVLDATDGALTCRGRTVYVVVDTGDYAPTPVPKHLRAALT
jgi:acyl-CoA thioester hydrolase